MTLKKTLEMVRGFRKDDDATPLVLMGYYNPIYIYGVEKFLADAKSAGVDGLIIVDLPPEEDDRIVPAGDEGRAQFHPAGDADHRRQAAAGRARQYFGLCLLRRDRRHYRRAGADAEVVGEAVARIKRHTQLPVCVGFGIRTPENARGIAAKADGAVVGTALVDALQGTLDAQGRATAKTVGAVADLVARWRRACGAPNRPRNKP